MSCFNVVQHEENVSGHENRVFLKERVKFIEEAGELFQRGGKCRCSEQEEIELKEHNVLGWWSYIQTAEFQLKNLRILSEVLQVGYK